MSLLQQKTAAEATRELRDPVDPQTLEIAAAIVADVRSGGEPALLAHAERLGDIQKGEPLILEPKALKAAWDRLDADTAKLLERTHDRILDFALAQRRAIQPLSLPLPGGRMGHTVAPVDRAGCYAPGGRFPLPSSVLMTAVTARAAAVPEVWVASPHPNPVIQAAAHVAKADGLITVGGAQAIAAMAYGAGRVPACQAIVGPGNRFVTAAKQLVSGRVVIDMLAGPSEVMVVADDSADPRWVAADILAQCEHDPDASAVLISLSEALLPKVEAELARQLPELSTESIARQALSHSFTVIAQSLDEASELANHIAPEHLELQFEGAANETERFRHYGALFVGPGSAEVFGDYGMGPNHVLPTGGTAQAFGGLSVMTFLRVRTFIEIDQRPPKDVTEDAAQLASIEGLPAHQAAASFRLDLPSKD